MTIFSQKLKDYTQNGKMNMHSLAKNCGIDRASLYQVVNGKRDPNPTLFRRLLENLPLTPGEQDELVEAYEMVTVGEATHRRRKKVAEIIASLETVSPFENAPIQAGYGHCYAIEGAGTGICGETEVNRTVRAMLELESQRGGRITVVAQPEYRFLFDSIVSLKTAAPALEMTHLICLEEEERSGESGYNLNCVHTVLRSGMVHPNYRPLFYYDSVNSHFGKMSLMSYLIVTETSALQISRDLRSGLLFRDREQLELLKRMVLEMKQNCRPAAQSVPSMSALHGLYEGEVQTAQALYATSYDLWTLPFLDRELLNECCDRRIPEWDLFAGSAEEQMETLRQKFCRKSVCCMAQAEGLKRFLETGMLHEFPPGRLDRPLSRNARKLVLERMIRGVEEDWHQMRLYRPGKRLISFNGAVAALDRGSAYVQYNGVADAYAYVYRFSERSISFAFYDYLESLWRSRHVLSKEETLRALKEAAAGI